MLWIASHQLNLMLFMSGVCGILAFSTMLIKSLPPKRKSILALMEFAAMLLLIFDRFSYLYRGDLSEAGFIIVRISNGLVYFLQIFIPFMVAQYLKDLYVNEGRMDKVPLRLRICDLLFAAGVILIIITQFTGLYYTIDEQNYYLRSPLNFLCYVVPIAIVLIEESLIIQYRDRLGRRFFNSLTLSLALPTVASVIQYFNYGLSITNMTMVLVVIVFYIYTLIQLSRALENARKRELAVLTEAQKKEKELFRQTVEALANAVDAKDQYTHGHSSRVAAFSRQIAEEAGYSEEFCEQVYESALLHDIGKIGIPDEILKKPEKLTAEEFEEIRLHPILGYQILSSIRLSPELGIGAHYHHEHYDGSGYPDGLAGEEIPTAARIIAVADAYDAMTSTRSYRNALSPLQVKEELIRGIGKQFDPQFARIMIRLNYGESAVPADEPEQ